MTGGNPPQRPDQQLMATSRAGVGPAPTTPFVFARTVIISGTSSTNLGLFEYIGTPGPGNPPVTWIVPPGTTADPYGNTLPASGGVVTMAQGGGLLAQLASGVLSFGNTLSPDPMTWTAALRLLATAAGANPLLAMDSPSTGADEAHSSLWMAGDSTSEAVPVPVGLFAATGAGAGVSLEFILCGTLAFGHFSALPVAYGPSVGGTTATTVVVSPNGTITPATTALLEVQGAITTTGTLDAIVSGAAETWHALAPTLAGWSQAAGSTPLQYRLLASPPNTVEITGSVSGGALAAGTIALATLPAGYVPPTNPTPAMWCLSVGRNAINDPPNLVVTTGGVMQIRNAQGATGLQFSSQFSIDTN
jgi:hypothetical protein